MPTQGISIWEMNFKWILALSFILKFCPLTLLCYCHNCSVKHGITFLHIVPTMWLLRDMKHNKNYENILAIN